MEQEKEYLLTALEKTGCIVIVCSYAREGAANRRKIEYISPNVPQFGMNAESLKQGYRLIEDYILPADRDSFNEALKMAFHSKEDFAFQFHIIGDDNKVRLADVDISVQQKQEALMEVEFIMREAAPAEERQNGTGVDLDGDGTEDVRITGTFFRKTGIAGITEQMASLFGLYSVVLDMNGRPLVKPTGPKAYFGEFYNGVRDPKYLSLLKQIAENLRENPRPYFAEIQDDNPDSRVAVAPFFVKDTMVGIWILYAYTQQQIMNLFKVYQQQFELAQAISSMMEQLCRNVSRGTAVEREERDLSNEISTKRILGEVLEAMYTENHEKFAHAVEKVGQTMDLDYIVCYLADPDSPDGTHMLLRDYWAKDGKSPEAEEVFGWEHDHYNEEMRRQIAKDGLFIDRRTMTNQMRVEIFRGNARAVMVVPLKAHKKVYGRLILIENTNERVWTRQEIRFAKLFGQIVSKYIVLQHERSKGILSSTTYLEDVFNAIDAEVLIRNRQTGEILFLNASLNEKLGGEFLGADSFRIVPRISEEYEGFSGNMKTAAEPTKFRRYINELGNIYDVTEIRTKWNNKDDADILVLVPVKQEQENRISSGEAGGSFHG